jgi:predicted RecA/RadA family phage recombinase
MLIKYQSTLPTLTDKQAADFQVDINGRLITTPSGNVAAAATDSGNPVKVGGKYNVTLPTLTDGQRGDLQINSKSTLLVSLIDTTGNQVAIGQGTLDGLTTGTTGAVAYSREYVFNGSTWDRLVKPNATSRLLSSAATTNATNVKASAGNVHKIVGNNTVAVKKYLKLYNKATAPVPGTDTPVLTYVIPVSAVFSFDLSDLGTYFSAGIGYAITAAAADADATAIGAGDIECLNIIYS